MHDQRITAIETRDVRFPLLEGAGSDAIHSGSEYAFATTLITTEAKEFGTGIVLTLGNGNQLVCRAIEMLAQKLIGRDVEELDLSIHQGRQGALARPGLGQGRVAKGCAACSR